MRFGRIRRVGRLAKLGFQDLDRLVELRISLVGNIVLGDLNNDIRRNSDFIDFVVFSGLKKWAIVTRN